MGMTAAGPARTRTRAAADRLPQASPEEAGLDGRRLDAMEQAAREWGIRSVFVAKDGHRVWEWHEAGADRPAAVFSCS